MVTGTNEAAFETRVVEELRRLFPALRSVKLNIQNILTLQLGHRTATVDGKASERIHGRFDVLVSIDDKPAILFEHKRPGLKLTDDDRDQAISYARLLNPMPPLCVVSNGSDLNAFKTINKAVWNPSSVDEKAVDDLIREGMQLADSDLDDAISRLLGRDPSVWKPVVAAFTKDNIEDISGSISDLTRPLARGFSIPRRAVQEALEYIKKGHKLVALTGSPLSGKTNILAQLAEACSRTGGAPLYLDAADASTGIFQTIANMFSEKLFRSRSPDDVRQWLMMGLKGATTAKLVFLVDGWTTANGRDSKESLHELLRISENAQIAVVLATDDATWTKIAYQPGRTELTRIGRKGVVVEVGPLEDDECEYVNALSFALGAAFQHGWRSNPDFRYPRTLRFELAEVVKHAPAQPSVPAPNAQEGIRSLPTIPPITTIALLERISRQYLSHAEQSADYKEFAKLCLQQLIEPSSAELMLFCYRRGAVRRDVARAHLGERLQEMISVGHLREADSPGDPVVIPTLPEAVSAATIPFIRQSLDQKIRDGQLESAIDYFLRCAASLPLGEIAAALCLTTLRKETFDPIVSRLIEMQPRRATLRAGSRVLMQVAGRQLEHTITEEEAAEGGGIDNIWPTLILSHLAGNLAVVGKDNVPDTDINFHIWWEIGSFADVMISVPGNSIRSYHTHNFEGGTCLCSEGGIIEPITWSMQCAFHLGLNDMSQLATEAVRANRHFLALRLHHAAQVAVTATDEDTVVRARQVRKILAPYLRTRYEAMADQLIRENPSDSSNDSIEEISR